MKNGFRIFDSDLHCVEPPDLWERYIDKTYRRHIVRTSELTFQYIVLFFQIDDVVMPYAKQFAGIPPAVVEKLMSESPQSESLKRMTEEKYRRFYERRWSGAALLDGMDVEGVDVTVVFPTAGLLAMGVNDLEPDFAAAIARAYNDYLYDLCQADQQRLYGAAMISVHDVGRAIAESERAVKELGFKAVFLRPNLVHARTWYDPYYDPLWEAIQDLGVPVAFHEGIDAALPHVGDCFGLNLFLHHIACHPMEMMLAVMNFCGGGILEKDSRLRVAFLEGNVGWLPWLLDRMDDHYELSYAVTDATLPEKPSVCFKRHCYLSAECDETMTAAVVQRFGADNFVTSTDFPHPDSKYPRAMDTFIGKPDLSVEEKRRILWDNCVTLYGMQDKLLPSIAAPEEMGRVGPS